MASRSRCKANAGGGADPDLAGLGWALARDLARGLCVAVTIALIGPEIVGGEPMMDAGYFQEISGWSPKEQPPAYYRAAAARARKLRAESTTPRLKQYLGEVIARCERLADEIEEPS
jgi:hypothetical protein